MTTKLSNPRILALDLLRGYFMFVIIVNHIGRFPSFYDLFTARGELWVSAAEGFFLISGILIGYVYGPKFLNNLKSASRKLWLRAGKLYLWSVFFTLFFTFIGLIAGMPPGTKPGLLETNLSNLIYQTLTLKYIYGWADFLPHFVIFLLFAPLVLFLITRKKWWVALLLSILIWFLRGNSFDMAWQLLFVIGIICGYYLPNIEKYYKNILRQNRIILSVTVVSIATLGIAINLLINKLTNESMLSLSGSFSSLSSSANIYKSSLSPYFDKISLAPGRLFFALICFVALYLLFRKFEKQIDKYSFGFLKVMGQKPLFVYGLSAVVIYPLQIIIAPISNNLITNMAIDTVVLVFIYFSSYYRDNIIIYVKRRFFYLMSKTRIYQSKKEGFANDK